MRILQGAAPLPESRIRLAWSDGAVWGDGAEAVLDLPPAKGGVLAFLTDPAAFNAVAVGPRDRTLAWRDPEVYGIDLRADTLWRPHHSATEAV